MLNVILPLVFVACMGALIGGYVFFSGRVQRDTRKVIMQAFGRRVVVAVDQPASFRCSHFSIGNAMSVSCGICGPLPPIV